MNLIVFIKRQKHCKNKNKNKKTDELDIKKKGRKKERKESLQQR